MIYKKFKYHLCFIVSFSFSYFLKKILIVLYNLKNSPHFLSLFLVTIISPRITQLNQNITDNQFKPITSSPYLLTINENMNQIVAYDGLDSVSYKNLMSVPIKPTDSGLSLADIKNNGSLSRTAVFVDLIVIVRYLKPAREVRTVRGVVSCREIIVMDQSLPGMCFSIWGSEYIERFHKYLQN